MNGDNQLKVNGLAEEVGLLAQNVLFITQGIGKTASDDVAFYAYNRLDQAVRLVRTAAEALLTGPREEA